jgi:hypothetical protein
MSDTLMSKPVSKPGTNKGMQHGIAQELSLRFRAVTLVGRLFP